MYGRSSRRVFLSNDDPHLGEFSGSIKTFTLGTDNQPPSFRAVRLTNTLSGKIDLGGTIKNPLDLKAMAAEAAIDIGSLSPGMFGTLAAGDILVEGDMQGSITIDGPKMSDITVRSGSISGSVIVRQNMTPHSTLSISGGVLSGTVEVGGDLSGTISFLPDVPAASMAPTGKVLIGGILAGSGRINVPAGNLAGQIVLNANGLVAGTAWNGVVSVGGLTLAPAPNYSALPTSLGGGSVGVVPFRFREDASFPGIPASGTRQYAVQEFFTQNRPIRLEFYGPVSITATPATIWLVDPDGNLADVDVTALFTFSVDANSPRELRISRSNSPAATDLDYLGDRTVPGSIYGSRLYRIEPTSALKCDPDFLLAAAPSVPPFAYEIELIYNCDDDPRPDPDQIMQMDCYDCYNAATGLEGTDGKLDKCQLPVNSTNFRANGIWTGCTRCLGSCIHGYPADFTANNGANIDDVFVYLNAWFAARPCTDVDGNGVNIDDIFLFLNAWFAVCPCELPSPRVCPSFGC
jgi:hypothetical protein